MQIKLTGHHIDLTDALRDYVTGKMERLTRHSDHLTDIDVILDVEKLQHKAEATVHLRRSKLHAQAIENDMYAAIDSLVDKLDRQIVRHKEKLTDHHRSEGALKNQQ
jgi:ribosomal subunit interface protein